MDKVLKTLLSLKPEEGFRHWRKEDYDIYKKLLGKRKFIGIEIETNAEKIISTEAIQQQLKERGFGITTEFKQGNFECIYLFDVSDPKKFVKSVHKCVEILRIWKVPTTGALHINIQCERGKIYWYQETRVEQYGHEDIVGDNCKYGRVEFKNCSGFYNVQCLIAQMLIKSQRMTIYKHVDKGVNQIKRAIIKNYPKGIEVLAINLGNDML